MISRGRLIWVDFGIGNGSEQSGIRPAVVVQNDIGNKYSPTTIVAPITSQQDKSKLPTHVLLETDLLNKKSTVLCEQIRIIDKKRVKSEIGSLPSEDIIRIDNALLISMGFIPCHKQ